MSWAGSGGQKDLSINTAVRPCVCHIFFWFFFLAPHALSAPIKCVFLRSACLERTHDAQTAAQHAAHDLRTSTGPALRSRGGDLRARLFMKGR